MKCSNTACDNETSPFGTGKLRKFCSPSCRTQVSSRNQASRITAKRKIARESRPLVSCRQCGRETVQKTANAKTFCSRPCKNKYAGVKHGRKMKAQAVAYKGGKCQRCGYHRCFDVLHFHHRNPSQKTLSLNKAHLASTMWEKIKHELDKCDLLCANCHGEVHAELFLEPLDHQNPSRIPLVVG
jgi:hypothetical protein